VIRFSTAMARASVLGLFFFGILGSQVACSRGGGSGGAGAGTPTTASFQGEYGAVFLGSDANATRVSGRHAFSVDASGLLLGTELGQGSAAVATTGSLQLDVSGRTTDPTTGTVSYSSAALSSFSTGVDMFAIDALGTAFAGVPSSGDAGLLIGGRIDPNQTAASLGTRVYSAALMSLGTSASFTEMGSLSFATSSAGTTSLVLSSFSGQSPSSPGFLNQLTGAVLNSSAGELSLALGGGSELRGYALSSGALIVLAETLDSGAARLMVLTERAQSADALSFDGMGYRYVSFEETPAGPVASVHQERVIATALTAADVERQLSSGPVTATALFSPNGSAFHSLTSDRDNNGSLDERLNRSLDASGIFGVSVDVLGVSGSGLEIGVLLRR
jgi:hypothetical protein